MKYYAVRKGRTPGIFIDWQKCQESVKGFKGAEFKSFTDETSARRYLLDSNQAQTMSENIDSDTLIAYTDGSYTPKYSKYGSGLVILDHNQTILNTGMTAGDDPDAISMNNVAGEIQAAILAMEWAIDNSYQNLIINYDYEGIANWCTNAWKANKPMTKHYQEFYNECKDKHKLKVYFNKINAHTGHTLNELADKLAKYPVGLSTREQILGFQVKHATEVYLTENFNSWQYQLIDIILATELSQRLIMSISNHHGMEAKLDSDICIDETWIKVSATSSLTECAIRFPLRFQRDTLMIGDIENLTDGGTYL